MTGPLESASALLERRLDARTHEVTARVAVIGHSDLTPEARTPAPLWPREVNVLLGPRQVLVVAAGPVDGCARCVAGRWQRLQDRFVRDTIEAGVRGHVPAGLAVTDAAVDAVAAALATVTGLGPHHVIEVSLADLRTRTVRFLPDPLCPSCAAPEPAPVRGVLRARLKTSPGQLRLVRPEQYPIDEPALVNPVCGVVGRSFTPHLYSPTNAPVAGGIAERASTEGLIGVCWSGHAERFATSRRIGLFEGLERYAGARPRRRDAVRRASFAELGPAAVDPREIGLYGDAAYRRNNRLTEWTPQRQLPWVAGWSIRDDREVLVPERIAHFAAGQAADNYVYGSSNGCATGASYEEAVLHGLLEVIERDSFLIGWYGSLPLPELDLAQWEDREVHDSVARAGLAGYDVRVFDNRLDLGVPSVAAVAVRRDDGLGSLAFSACASLRVLDAIRAATAELVAVCPGMPGRVERRRPALEAMAADFGHIWSLSDHAELYGLPRMRGYAEAYLAPRARRLGPGDLVPEPPTADDLLADVHTCLTAFYAAGLDVVVIDQTSAEQRASGLVCVQVLVPGAIPLDFGWHNQRALRLPRTRVVAREYRVRHGLPEQELLAAPHPFP